MRAWAKNTWGQFRYRHKVLELLISVCLACLVWVYIHNRTRISIDRVAVPVQVQLAPQQRDQYVLEVSEQRSVTVSFTGPTGRIREIRRQLQRGHDGDAEAERPAPVLHATRQERGRAQQKTRPAQARIELLLKRMQPKGRLHHE